MLFLFLNILLSDGFTDYIKLANPFGFVPELKLWYTRYTNVDTVLKILPSQLVLRYQSWEDM